MSTANFGLRYNNIKTEPKKLCFFDFEKRKKDATIRAVTINKIIP